MNDTKIIEQLLTLGYKISDIEKSLTNRRFDEIFGIYSLLQNGSGRKLSRSKPESLTSIASSATTIGTAAAAPSSTTSVPSTTPLNHASSNKSETTTNGDGLKETSFMTINDDTKTAKLNTNPPSSPEPAANFKRQHTIGPESLKERNAIRLNTVSGIGGISRPISATPKVAGERNLQKSPVKPLRAFKPESSLSTTAQTPRRPNVNVYKKVDNNSSSGSNNGSNAKDNTSNLLAPSSAANSSSSTSSAFQRNGMRSTFHSGQSRMTSREHNTLGSKTDSPAFAKGNFLQRLTTRFSKRFRLNGSKHPSATPTNTTDSSNSK
jgi:hypothetical protein